MSRRLWLLGSMLMVATLGGTTQAAGPEPPEVSLAFEKYDLENGLEVILHRDITAPLIAVNVWYHVGSGDESPGKSGFAHLFEHMMFQGTENTGEDVHFDILRQAGASSINGTTNAYRTNYYETVPAHEIETALWLESDRMGFLLGAIDQPSFANQVDVVRNERRQRYDNVPYGKARFVVAASLYPEGHPYRYLTIGRHQDLVRASLEDVRGFFRTWYTPANATLAIAGDFDIDDMKALVAKWFGPLKGAPRPRHPEVSTTPLKEIVVHEVADAFARVEQLQRTWIGPPALSAQSVPLEVLLQVLTASGWGRLSRRLVIEEPLCASVWAYLADRPISSEIVVAARLKPGASRERVRAIIDEELARLQREPVEAAEVARVIAGVEASFVWGLEDLARRADQLQFFNHFTGDPGYAGEYLDRLRKVRAEDVQKAARTWLSRPYSEVVSVPVRGEGASR